MSDKQEQLAFIQRVLESNAPESDRAAAAQMVRDMRRALMRALAHDKETVLELMRARSDRELYEGAGPDGKTGSGMFFVTYSAGERYAPLTAAQVAELERGGRIRQKWPGCYMLAEPKP